MSVQLELFTEPKTPTGPQERAILSYFKSGGSLTVKEAIDRFGVYALSQRCGGLRRLGWPIKSEIIKTGTGKHVARYFL